ncbi:MAG: hypothetical protein AB1400_07855 [Pseudomonadota bacterium]
MKPYAIRTTLIAVCALLLTACALPQIHHNQLVGLNLGMTPVESERTLQLAPLSSYPTAVEGVSYTFQRYNLNNGMELSLYLLAFEDNKLKYWGYIEDFRRHPDKRLVRALDNVMPAIAADLRRKK